ncbi:hypothetical protein M079_2373 [Bacteroides fragilis str. 3996 N(B) 6]|uniref:Uncharacterized protein n=1 Tax=Bacteroides fragilis str. 3998T(B)3 TaxID=1339316 RepID=A0A015XCT3_BACFG|nr:hypothetical protein M079_2373 [Bacteroides fragilis str. 3996 N(B) 6]EXY90475.1 hypothetical protein M125_2804 [Bacteroides fragilis str. 3998T(B)3]EXY95411.1 hypothetical protein M081_2452 [Bacteroides fragilis str. 3998 T(B) 4]
MNFQAPPITESMFFISNISKQDQRVFFIEPKHSAATTGI